MTGPTDPQVTGMPVRPLCERDEAPTSDLIVVSDSRLIAVRTCVFAAHQRPQVAKLCGLVDGQGPAFSRFAMIRPIQSTRRRSREHRFCASQGRRVVTAIRTYHPVTHPLRPSALKTS